MLLTVFAIRITTVDHAGTVETAVLPTGVFAPHTLNTSCDVYADGGWDVSDFANPELYQSVTVEPVTFDEEI